MDGSWRSRLLSVIGLAGLVVLVSGSLGVLGGDRTWRSGDAMAPLVQGTPGSCEGMSLSFRLEARLPEGEPLDLQAAIDVLDGRTSRLWLLSETLSARADIRSDGARAIVIDLDGVTDRFRASVERVLTAQGYLEIVDPMEQEVAVDSAVTTKPLSPPLVWREPAAASPAAGNPLFPAILDNRWVYWTSRSIDEAGRPAVEIVLNPEGAALLAEYLREDHRRPVAVVIDGTVAGVGPVLAEDFSKVLITGLESMEADALHLQLGRNPMPFPVDLAEKTELPRPFGCALAPETGSF